MTNSATDKAPTMDEHIFRWFNKRHPDLMAECLRDYPDDDPAYAALVEEEAAALTEVRRDPL